MKLFYSTGTSATPCHIALEEAGPRYERVEVSWERELNLAELDAVNPLGAVPVLVLEGGLALTQSLAILQHVADTHPAAGLLGQPGSLQRARALEWASFAATDAIRAFVPLIRAEDMTTNVAAQADVRAFALAKLQSVLAHVDAALGKGGEWITGERFSIADPYLWFVLRLSGWVGVPMQAWRHIDTYLARLEARPATRRILELEELL